MDGHHRFEVAKLMGLRSYRRYCTIMMKSRSELRKNIIVNKEVILNDFKNGLIFSYKTAKHSFPVEDAEIRRYHYMNYSNSLLVLSAGPIIGLDGFNKLNLVSPSTGETILTVIIDNWVKISRS